MTLKEYLEVNATLDACIFMAHTDEDRVGDQFVDSKENRDKIFAHDWKQPSADAFDSRKWKCLKCKAVLICYWADYYNHSCIFRGFSIDCNSAQMVLACI